MAGAVVALERVDGDVRAGIRRALEAAEWTRAVPAGADVSLKVNLGWDLFIPGAITSALVLEALVQEIAPHVRRIHVVESDQVLEDVEKAFRRSGMDEVCRRHGLRWVNLTRHPTVTVERPDNRILRRVEVPAILRDTVLITVPVMKTHGKTTLSGALKNQWGCIGTMRHEYHLVLDDAIADLNAVLCPALALMDATIGLEGNGPKSGRSRVADRILCSRDPVALDTVQALSMGLDPSRIGHLATCAARGIGVGDPLRIEVRGVDSRREAVRFRPARHNAVSRVETTLRKSALRRLVFKTPVFRLCLIGAKAYYRAWTLLHAHRSWRLAREHPAYGAFWRTLPRA